jgi:alanyl-tRNA synthetase
VEGSRIREAFLVFFEARDHARVRSSSLIPPPESGLLLTNAGMNQFIPYFLGQAEPPYRRAVTSQKVMRTNDIENVGRDARHLTFFEMLGNFSFADYFKADAIAWAHELITEIFGIEHDRLWVTVYEDDDEAADAWVDGSGSRPADRPRGKLDAQGEPGRLGTPTRPGPRDRAARSSSTVVRLRPRGQPGRGRRRAFMEIWNLVFIRTGSTATLRFVEPLPAKNVDTGVLPGARRDAAPGGRQRLRDGPAPAGPRGGSAGRGGRTAPTRATMPR